mgnify:CR=1 FL=1
MPIPLRIVADANIPHVADAIGPFGGVRTRPGRAITRSDLKQADVLLVRSVTQVDAALRDDTPVRFVGTATAGTDHIDAEALRQRGSAFASAPGSNAASVVDYVIASLLAVAAERGERLSGRTLGVVGVGEVGRRLVPRARALGLDVVVSDPPRSQRGEMASMPLAALLQVSDIVTLHTPLAAPAESAWPTLDLIDAHEAALLKPTAWLVNAARGGVVSLDAASGLAASRPVVLDVWPGEPGPNPDLVRDVALGTPHIAGYATDAKLRGTQRMAEALAAWTGSTATWTARDVLSDPAPLATPDGPADTPVQQVAWLDALARQAYDVRSDDARFREALAEAPADERAHRFATLRKHYPLRRLSAGSALSGGPRGHASRTVS